MFRKKDYPLAKQRLSVIGSSARGNRNGLPAGRGNEGKTEIFLD
jgi:hypothetical protein